MKRKTYAEKLKSPKWQKKRLDILNLKGFKCEKCGDEENQIQVHHRFYITGREPWEYDNDVFQVLCEKCHEASHKKEVETIEVVPVRYQELIMLLDETDLLATKHLVHTLTNFKNEYGDIITLIAGLSFATAHDLISDFMTQCSRALKEEQLEERIDMLVARIDDITYRQNEQNG